MATIVKTGGGVPVSDYEALQAQLNSLQSQYNSLQSEHNTLVGDYAYYRQTHAHTNEEYEAHDIVHSKTIAIWCRWYGGERGHELYIDGAPRGYTGPDGDSSRTVYYTVTI